MSKPVHKRYILFTVFKEKNRFLKYKLPALAFALFIFAVSSLPGDKIPYIGFNLGDKFIHMLVFGLFGIFLYRVFRYPRPLSRPYLLTLCVGIPYAALDEIHQLFVPGRYCGIGDFIADVLGVIIFAGISAKLNPLNNMPAVKDIRQ